MSKLQGIPEAAVEAAAKAMWDRIYRDNWPWTGSGELSEEYIDDARAALEAALPYLCPQPSQVATQAARLRATLDERLGRGAPHTREGDHE